MSQLGWLASVLNRKVISGRQAMTKSQGGTMSWSPPAYQSIDDSGHWRSIPTTVTGGSGWIIRSILLLWAVVVIAIPIGVIDDPVAGWALALVVFGGIGLMAVALRLAAPKPSDVLRIPLASQRFRRMRSRQFW
jgi:hypothetical protein